jgi:hypothetical protein
MVTTITEPTTGVNIPLEYLGFAGLIVMAMFIGLVYFFIYWSDMRSKNPELHVFNTARHKPFLDIVALIDLSGRHFFFNAEKDKPHDVKLKKDDYGLMLDSRLASKRPRSRLEDGISIMYYGTNFHFPVDPNGARTLVQLVRKIRKEYPQLNFIRDDIVLLELLTKSGEDIGHDIKIVLEMYPLESLCETGTEKVAKGKEKDKIECITEDDLVKLLKEIKGKLKDWRVEPAWFSMKEGIELLPIGTTSADMKRAVTIEKINTQNEMGRPLEWWKDMLPVFILGMSAMVIAYLVVTAMK